MCVPVWAAVEWENRSSAGEVVSMGCLPVPGVYRGLFHAATASIPAPRQRGESTALHSTNSQEGQQHSTMQNLMLY